MKGLKIGRILVFPTSFAYFEKVLALNMEFVHFPEKPPGFQAVFHIPYLPGNRRRIGLAVPSVKILVEGLERMLDRVVALLGSCGIFASNSQVFHQAHVGD